MANWKTSVANFKYVSFTQLTRCYRDESRSTSELCYYAQSSLYTPAFPLNRYMKESSNRQRHVHSERTTNNNNSNNKNDNNKHNAELRGTALCIISLDGPNIFTIRTINQSKIKRQKKIEHFCPRPITCFTNSPRQNSWI